MGRGARLAEGYEVEVLSVQLPEQTFPLLASVSMHPGQQERHLLILVKAAFYGGHK